jgi:hypothetical protein
MKLQGVRAPCEPTKILLSSSTAAEIGSRATVLKVPAIKVQKWRILQTLGDGNWRQQPRGGLRS